MLRLPQVTLVTVETIAHELARLTIEDCLGKVEFGGVLICTNDPAKINVSGAQIVTVPHWPNKHEYMGYQQYEACDPVKTDFILFLEWDAGLCDVNMWTDDFLQYDYIGAPWWYSSLNVGNGGFSLRSMRLQRFVMDNYKRFPDFLRTDAGLCRDYRPQLEAEGGFKWAPVTVANDFAMEERGRMGLPSNLRHFGFHGANNWEGVLARDDFVRRRALVNSNHYASGKASRFFR